MLAQGATLNSPSEIWRFDLSPFRSYGVHTNFAEAMSLLINITLTKMRVEDFSTCTYTDSIVRIFHRYQPTHHRMSHNRYSEQSIADFGFAESLRNTKPLGHYPNISLFDPLHTHCHP